MVLPVWICSAVGKENDAVTSVFATTLTVIDGGPNHHPKLQIAAARLLSRLTGCVSSSSVLQPLFVDPSFKFLPKEVR